MDIFCENFAKLVQLGVLKEQGERCFEYGKSVSGGYMDWVVEFNGGEVPHEKGYVLSLTHYFEQNGDLCKDPDMTIAVYPELKAVEALTFQQDLPPRYCEVYPEPGRVFVGLKKELNSFLNFWLLNLVDQGHGNWIKTKDEL